MRLPMQTKHNTDLSNNEGIFYGAKFKLTSAEMERNEMDHYERLKKKQERQIEDEDHELQKKICNIKFIDKDAQIRELKSQYNQLRTRLRISKKKLNQEELNNKKKAKLIKELLKKPVVCCQLVQPKTGTRLGYGIHPRNSTPEHRPSTPTPSTSSPSTLSASLPYSLPLPPLLLSPLTPLPSLRASPSLPLSPQAHLFPSFPPTLPTRDFNTTLNTKTWICKICNRFFEGEPWKIRKNHLNSCKKNDKNKKKNQK